MLVRESPHHLGIALCAAGNLAPWSFRVTTEPSCSPLPIVTPSPGIKSDAPASSWPSLPVSAFRPSPCTSNVTRQRSGALVSAMPTQDCRACSPTTGKGAPDKRSGFPPLQRAQIIQLACLEPVARGLHITHWSSADLARQAVADGIVDAISPRSIRRILHAVDLQPHRTRFWKTARLNAQFMERTVKILWCYSYADHLARHGCWVVCTDELPNFQILERVPIRRAIPGSIEQREFEYKRHGTMTVLVFLIVHTGQMEAVCFESKSAIHYTEALRHFRRRHRHLRGVYLIHDGDSTHTGDCTPGYLSDFRHWWHPRLLPPDASWLNQAEPLLDAFELHYLKRGSWCSKEEFRQHIEAAWPEYNRLYAHPFDWEWTIPKMKQWFAKHSQ
jgi:hypothetical protein